MPPASGRWVAKLSEEEKAEKEANASAKAAEKGEGKGKDAGKGKGTVDAKGKDKGKGKGKDYDYGWYSKGKDYGKGKDYSKGKGKFDDYSKGGKGGGKSKGDDAEDDDIGRRAYFNQLKEVFVSTSAQASDIDSKAIQLLDELCGKQNKTEALCAYLKEGLAAVSREKVSNWSAYFFTLLRKFDPAVYEAMREERGRPKRESRQKKDRSGAPDIKLNVEAPAFTPGQQWAGA